MVRIARNEKRARIDMLLWEIRVKDYSRINEYYAKIVELQVPEPMEIVEPAKPRDKPMDCGIFVFEEKNDMHNIVPSNLEDNNRFYNEDPRPFLKGYFNPILDLEAHVGDIAIYMPIHIGQGVHFGIYKGDGRILSKWGWDAPVLVHDIDLVPGIYGDEILFYRKGEC